MISSSTWVPRGFASEFPEKYELDDAEMERISKLAQLELDDAQQDLDEAQEEEEPSKKEFKDQIEIDDDLKEYNLEHYDSTDDEGEAITMFPGLATSDAKYHQDGDDENEAYISLPTETDLQEEKHELQVYPTDNMILATRTEDDISYLDVYIYDDGAGAPNGSNEEEEDKFDQDVAKGLVRESNLYIHHDLMLPAFPLCVEWINYKPNQQKGIETNDNIGNFAAVGTFDPQIEIWNLDCVDKAFPDLILGEPQSNSLQGIQTKKNKKKKKKSKDHVTTHHTDAILSLSHNRIHRSVLASTSADGTVKLWDLNTGLAVRSMNEIHGGKTVSASQWHPTESSILLTGGYDGAIAITDVKISDSESMTKRWFVNSGEEVENIKWCDEKLIIAGTDNGNIYCFDASKPESKPLWTLQGHDAGISSLECNRFLPGLLVTAAMGEKSIKIWKVPTEEDKSGPSMITSRDFGLGNVLTSSFAPDIEVSGNLTIGGVNGELKMWDLFSNRAVRTAFPKQLRVLQKNAREEAKAVGRSSRIARKYGENSTEETVVGVETGDFSDESDDEEQMEGVDDAGDDEDDE